MTDQPPTLGAVAESLGWPPLTPWQQQFADAVLRGEVVSMPRQNGRQTIADHIAQRAQAAQDRPSPPAAGPTRLVQNDIVFTGNACPDGCCRSIRSRSFPQPPWTEEQVYVRPMFQIIADHPLPDLDDEDGMHVAAAEYDRPDRIFL